VRRLFGFAASAEGIAPRYVPASMRMVHRSLTTPFDLGGKQVRLVDCRDSHREMEFCYPIPESSGPTIERGWLRGFMDFVFTHEGVSWVLDWKTDVLADYGPEALAERIRESYQLQVEVYGLALAKILEGNPGTKFGGVIYVFLRGTGTGGGVHVIQPTPEDLERYRKNLIAFEYQTR
jgi:exodeoxyribonuclease V beta subunit